jgi:APA family basic amino acid/polyamine antiporter
MTKKYGLLTAICMVVGVVIGSGVFFKVQNILEITEGNVITGVLALVIGGVIMIICATTFSLLATKYTKINGVVDYSHETVGKSYGNMMAWFLATIYYPAMTSVLVWVTARYTGVLFGWDITGANVMTLGVVYLVGILAVNAFAPILAGKLQVTTTAIKLIPLFLMGFVGLIYGLINNVSIFEVVDGEVVKTGKDSFQILIENFKASTGFNFKSMLKALVAAAFAYEGWMIATSISEELHNAKKNLPIALLFGTIIIMVVYVLYYLGVTGGATTDVLIHGGAQYAFLQIFGSFFGTLLNVFVVISCIGTLNGLMVATTRAFYTIGKRDASNRFDMFKTIDKDTNMPMNSVVIGLVLIGVWYVFFYGANLTESWFGNFVFDSSELPIITMYGMYFPIFINMIRKERKELGIIKGIILPIAALISSGFMVFAAIYSHGISVAYYMIAFVVIMALGILLFKLPVKEKKEI